MNADAVVDGVAKRTVAEAIAELLAEEDTLEDGEDTSLCCADKDDSAVSDGCTVTDPVGFMEIEFLGLFEDDAVADEVSHIEDDGMLDGCADADCVYGAESVACSVLRALILASDEEERLFMELDDKAGEKLGDALGLKVFTAVEDSLAVRE